MNLKFTKEQTEKIIKAYYKMYLQREVEVRIVVSKGYEGCFEIPCANVKMVVASKLEVLGETITTEIELSKSEVTDILKTVLAEEGCEVESIFYDAGLTTNEYLTTNFTSTYFSGVNVKVKRAVKQKQKAI